jgi:hypothetical protein
MNALRKIVLCAWLAAIPALAQNPSATGAAEKFAASEKVRSECVAHRRCICGRVLQVTPAGLVIESGYTNLLQPPFNHFWLTPASAAPVRPANLVEGTAPASPAIGVVFLTDFPKRQTVHPYDYVTLIGYPAGHCDYSPVKGLSKTIRRFAGGLERAVKLNMQASER